MMDEVSRNIGSLNAKVDALDEKLDVRSDSIEEKLDHIHGELCGRVKDHETRLRTQEKWRYQLVGVGSIGGFLITKIVEWIHGKL